MIAVSVDCRLKDRDNVEVPLECVKDAKSAIRFLRKNAAGLKVNPNKIVVAGGSAGGQIAAALTMIDGANDDIYDLSISCAPNAVILYNPYFKCQADLSPPNFVKAGLLPFITFLGSEDPAIKVEELEAFHESLKAAGNASEYYVGQGGKYGFCNGRNKWNPFFYWSLEWEDQFLVKHGIMAGSSNVKRPDGVGPVNVSATTQPIVSPVKPPEIFVRLDLDQSGTLTMEEACAMYLQQFHGRDANKDDVVVANEI